MTNCVVIEVGNETWFNLRVSSHWTHTATVAAVRFNIFPNEVCEFLCSTLQCVPFHTIPYHTVPYQPCMYIKTCYILFSPAHILSSFCAFSFFRPVECLTMMVCECVYVHKWSLCNDICECACARVYIFTVRACVYVCQPYCVVNTCECQ